VSHWLSAAPETPVNAVAWSADNLVAVACEHQVTILVRHAILMLCAHVVAARTSACVRHAALHSTKTERSLQRRWF